MPDDLVIVDMVGFYNFPWGRGKTFGLSNKGEQTNEETSPTKAADGKKSKKTAKKKKESSREVTEDTLLEAIEEVMEDDFEDDNAQPEEITVTVEPSGDLTIHETDYTERMEETGSDMDEGAGLVTLSRREDEIVLEVMKKGKGLKSITPLYNPKYSKRGTGNVNKESEESVVEDDNDTYVESPTKKKLTFKETANLCSVERENVKLTKSKIETLDKKSKSSEIIITKNKAMDHQQTAGNEKEKGEEGSNTEVDMEESFTVKAKEFTQVNTKHSEIVIPKAEIQNFGQEDYTCASRTLLSLRRAEDCSYEDIRVFNAQDNFVVKSCEIKVKIRNPKESNEDNIARVMNRGTVVGLDTLNPMTTSGTHTQQCFFDSTFLIDIKSKCSQITILN